MTNSCRGEGSRGRKRYSVECIGAAVKVHENDTSIGDICRKMGISEDLILGKAMSQDITRRKR